ncbi:hypothetical protein D1007_51154 [Hordeum vulgare]|nr:hypothetical protein D1007_51154 [Hordeum vulgare]
MDRTATQLPERNAPAVILPGVPIVVYTPGGSDAPLLGVLEPLAGHGASAPPSAAATVHPTLDDDDLRRRLQDVRFNSPRDNSDHDAVPPNAAASRLAPPPPPTTPVIIPPPCLLQCPRRFAFAHLRDAVHNPSGIIRQVLQAVGGNPAFAIGGSWRGEACLTFSSHLERERVLSRGLLNYEGNVLSIEPVEDAERCIAVFDELIELEAVGIPHELWHDAGVKFVLNNFGDICSVDQYCMQGDYTSVRVLIMVAAGLPTPESMIIRLPVSHDIKSVALKVMQQWTHGVNANPFARSSEDSISTASSSSGSYPAGGWAGPESTYPPAPPPSPSPPSPPPTSAAVGPVDTTSPPTADTSTDV